MKNKDLIIKVARRLDKFNLDEIIVVSELQEQEVKEILSNLIYYNPLENLNLLKWALSGSFFILV